MKIGIVTNLYPPYARGGAENVIVRTVGQLLAAGHDVFVITGHPRALGTSTVIDRSSTERVYRFFPKNLYFTLDDYKFPWWLRIFWHIIDACGWHSSLRVRQILQAERPDVVITHNLKGIGLSIPNVIRAEKIPHVHVLHDLQLLYPSGLLLAGQEQQPMASRFGLWGYQYFCEWRIGNPDIVISPSEYLKNAYLEAGFFRDTKIRVLRNPLPALTTPRPAVRSPGPLRLLYVGQLVEHKGVLFMLQALQVLDCEYSLLIVGDGQLRPAVEAAAAKDKHLRYLGYMPPGELGKFFSVVDAVVVPSLCYENSPTVIYEALNAGLPVVAARIGGVGELIQEGVSGYLFTPNDVKDFRRVLELLDVNKEQLLASGDNIRASVADLALERYVDRLLEIIQTSIRKQQSQDTVLD